LLDPEEQVHWIEASFLYWTLNNGFYSVFVLSGEKAEPASVKLCFTVFHKVEKIYYLNTYVPILWFSEISNRRYVNCQSPSDV